MADPAQALKGMQQALEALTPLDTDERQRAMTWLSETLGIEQALDGAGKRSGAAAGKQGLNGSGDKGDSATPKDFLAHKSPQTDVERITCLAYFLTKNRGADKFKTVDLTKLNTEAAGHRFSNAATTARNATNQNSYLAPAGGGFRQITAVGEKVVEALPDREAVTAVVKAAPKRRRRSTSRKSKSAT